MIFLEGKKNDRGFDAITVHCDPLEREQLFRLLGYLEGVGAPRTMQETYQNFLTLLTSETRVQDLTFV